MRQDIKYCRALYGLALKLGSTRNLSAVLNLIARNATENLKLKACSLGLLDRETKVLEIVASYGLGDEHLHEGDRVSNVPISREAMKGKPIVVPDLAKSVGAEKAGVASMLCVPLEMREQKIGVICVYTSAKHKFTRQEVDFLKSIGNLGAVAIENARLHQNLQRRLHEMSTISEISKRLLSSLKPQQIFNSIAETTAKSMGMKGCIVRLLDEKREKLELVASYGLSKEYLARERFVHAEKGLDDVRTGKPSMISDIDAHSSLEYPQETVREGIRSILGVPLISKGRVIGSIRVLGERSHVFLDEEVRFLQTLADHASLAIENARLHRIALRNWQDLVNEIWEKSDVWGQTERTLLESR